MIVNAILSRKNNKYDETATEKKLMIHIPEKQAATKLRNIGLNNERESMRHSVRESSDFHIKILEIFMLLFPLLRIFKFSAYNLQSGKIVSVNSSIDSVSDTRWCWICLFVKFEEEHTLDLSLFLPSPFSSFSRSIIVIQQRTRNARVPRKRMRLT